MPNQKVYFAVILHLLMVTQPATADHLPLWELGVSLGGISLPAYRGSHQMTHYLMPLPYASYRGEKLRIGREGIKGRFLNTDHVEVDVSLRISPPVKSRESDARDGMGNLDATLEVGPSVRFLIHHSRDDKTRLQLALPLRAVIGSDLSHFDHHGWTLHPHFKMVHQQPPHGQRWRLSISAGIVFGDNAYHDYYFGVDEDQVTTSRAAYQGSSGYSGARFTINYRHYYDRDWIFRTFFQYENLHGTAFRDSPLFTANETVAAGFLISRVFERSKVNVAQH